MISKKKPAAETGKKKSAVKFILLSYLVIFLIIATASTCCGIIILQKYGIDRVWLSDRALKAFINVFVLSAVFTGIACVLKFYVFDRPVKKVLDATDKISRGDFSIRLTGENSFIRDFELIYENFNRMAYQLSQTEALQSDFLSNVSHEMKTPLAVIQNYSTLLQTPGLTDEERNEYTKVILDTTGKMTELITNILRLNKLENQQIKLDSKIFNLGDSVAECLLGFEQVWEQKNINIETEIDDEVYVEADEKLLSLVWNNLISNAMKFTGEGGTVKVCCCILDEAAVVTVSDTGCGISREEGQHIFEKFYQGDTSHKTHGNGLGLALVKQVIDLTGGEIGVESEVGTGTTFTVKLKKSQNDIKQPELN